MRRSRVPFDELSKACSTDLDERLPLEAAKTPRFSQQYSNENAEASQQTASERQTNRQDYAEDHYHGGTY
jgi:hypothetical protein